MQMIKFVTLFIPIIPIVCQLVPQSFLMNDLIHLNLPNQNQSLPYQAIFLLLLY